MKNGLLIYCVLLTLAVAYLFYKINNCTSNCAPAGVSAAMSDGNIVFVNVDTLLEHYDYYISLRESLKKKQDSIDVILKNKGKELEGEIVNYQKRGANMTDQQRGAEEERLGHKQQQLVEYKNHLLDQLTEEEAVMQDSLHKHLVGYLKDMNKQTNFKFVFGYQRGNGILLANDSLDITQSVIEGLNKK